VRHGAEGTRDRPHRASLCVLADVSNRTNEGTTLFDVRAGYEERCQNVDIGTEDRYWKLPAFLAATKGGKTV
jgi:hypothetical protein